MKLFASLTSPFARKVRIVLAEKRLQYELVVDIPWNDDTQVPLYNPLGKVPVLVMEEGTALYDSRVIVEYLDTLSPVHPLLPEDTRQRILVKKWEALADGIADAAAAIFIEKKRPANLQSADWITRQHGKISSGLGAAAIELGDSAWCTGDSYSLADVALGATLGYLDFRFPEITWRQHYANLAKLQEKLLQRPAFSETKPR